ncbi:UDP-glucose dehydrogenase family protein [Haematomicrobium sanguinis]|uniref:UDP-glucose dehydrogenase family protein n=1 Tax=Haematomicrobium sanguinis TaxID=479106 RepID=UPI00047D562F|nr:UDP-glucose/GDP-mannose dehydrogenase family protein [Haematomicrobium sanguinis]
MVKTISVIGTGYLGATHAVCMAELGHRVVGIDVDERKISDLANGKVPFHEPGLPTLLDRNIERGTLTFTTNLAEGVADADVHFITVGTPQKAGETSADMSFVIEAVENVARSMTHSGLIVGKSTVPVGSARSLRDLAKRSVPEGIDVELVWNPEFLREGFAVEDTLTPDRIVVGANVEGQTYGLDEVYRSILDAGTPIITTDFETSELVKVAANAFLATKISFINAFAEVTEHVGGNITTLADAIGIDTRIGRRFLNAGLGFGGGCLPKDIRALQARVSELGLDRTMSFLNQVDDINLRRRARLCEMAANRLDRVDGKKVTVLGAAFKPDSDDVRDSPALDVASKLYEMGYDVTVFDPVANANAEARFPRLAYAESLEDSLDGADLLVLATEWSDFRILDPKLTANKVAHRQLIDARNVLSVAEWESEGWTVDALGRKFDFHG